MIEIICCIPIIDWDAQRVDLDKRSICADESETLSEVFERTGIRYPIPKCTSMLYIDGTPDFDGTLRNMPISTLHSGDKLWVHAITKLGLFSA